MSDTEKRIFWTIKKDFNISRTKPVALVGLEQPPSVNENRIAAIIPLHAPGDYDYDGKQSWGEWWVGTTPAAKAWEYAKLGKLMRSVAADWSDVKMFRKGTLKVYASSAVMVRETIKSVVLEAMAGPVVGKLVAKAGITGVTYYVVSNSMKKEVANRIDAAMYEIDE